MENQQIFKVKFDNIPSELQFNDDNMSCLTGDTVHFEVPYDKIRAYEFQKFTEDEGIFKIPFDINETTVYDVNIPQWVKSIGYWWLEGAISDDELANAINNLIERNIISLNQKMGNDI